MTNLEGYEIEEAEGFLSHVEALGLSVKQWDEMRLALDWELCKDPKVYGEHLWGDKWFRVLDLTDLGNGERFLSACIQHQRKQQRKYQHRDVSLGELNLTSAPGYLRI